MANNNVPQETRHLICSWCKLALGGAWSTLDEDKFQISSMSGGLTNYMYLCTLPNSVEKKSDEPSQVLVRIYGEVSRSMEFVLSNSVLFSILAERKLGPQLYGVFPEGRLEEFLPARPLKTAELSKPEISMQIAKKMARFHGITAPLCKKPTWLFSTIGGWVEKAIHFMKTNPRLVMNDKLHKYLSFDLQAEFQDLKQILLSVNSPIVFCHNDAQEGNILYKENCEEGEDSLMFVDLDYSNYNYRGFDIANHMMEWCYDYTYDQPPFFKFSPANYPSREQKSLFFREYLKHQDKVKDVDPADLEQLDLETDTFALASSFFWGSWSVVMAATSDLHFDYVEYAISRFNHYFQWKSKLVLEEAFPCSIKKLSEETLQLN